MPSSPPRKGTPPTVSESLISPGWNWNTTDNNPCQLTHQEDWMTSQLNYLIARQRQAELVSRAQQARLAREAGLARSASAPRWSSAHSGGRSPSPAPATLPD